MPGVYTSSRIQKRLLDALPLCLEADAIEKACKKSRTQPTAEQQKIIDAATAARDDVVRVQAFEKLGHLEHTPGHVRPALAQTDAWLDAKDEAVAA